MSQQTNGNIEKTTRYHGQFSKKGPSRPHEPLSTDLGEKRGLLSLDEACLLLMQGRMVLRECGIGGVAVRKILMRESFLVLSIRYFPPLDAIEGMAKSEAGGGGAHTDFFIQCAPNAAVHWRKHHSKPE